MNGKWSVPCLDKNQSNLLQPTNPDPHSSTNTLCSREYALSFLCFFFLSIIQLLPYKVQTLPSCLSFLVLFFLPSILFLFLFLFLVLLLFLSFLPLSPYPSLVSIWDVLLRKKLYVHFRLLEDLSRTRNLIALSPFFFFFFLNKFRLKPYT